MYGTFGIVQTSNKLLPKEKNIKQINPLRGNKKIITCWVNLLYFIFSSSKDNF